VLPTKRLRVSNDREIRSNCGHEPPQQQGPMVHSRAARDRCGKAHRYARGSGSGHERGVAAADARDQMNGCGPSRPDAHHRTGTCERAAVASGAVCGDPLRVLRRLRRRGSPAFRARCDGRQSRARAARSPESVQSDVAGAPGWSKGLAVGQVRLSY